MPTNKTIVIAVITLVCGVAIGYYIGYDIGWEKNGTNTNGVNSSGSGIRGIVLLGPQCPVVQEGEDCPDEPYATTLVVTTPDGADVLTTFTSSTDGTFTVSVSPGTYAIRSAAAANVLPYCSLDTVTVTSGAFTEVTVSCDTGIR